MHISSCLCMHFICVPTACMVHTSVPLTINNGSKARFVQLHCTILYMYYSYTKQSRHQATLPATMSQVSLVDDHTLHQPCVQSLSFKPRLVLWMPPHWAPFLWPTIAIATKSLMMSTSWYCLHLVYMTILWFLFYTHNNYIMSSSFGCTR